MGFGRVLMVQGTASCIGKSVLVALLCRLFRRAGLSVAPFKAQNMTRETARAACGGEIAVAQAVQAAAAGLSPTADMNPIVLRPATGRPLGLLLEGRPAGLLEPAAYAGLLPRLTSVVAASLARLRACHDLVVMEGAGSPVDTAWPADDLANMRLAALAEAPVLLVADLDRGGAAAALVGTLALLGRADRRRVGGVVLNRLRGEPAAFAPESARLARLAGRPVLGVIPHLGRVALPAEDGLDGDESMLSGAVGARSGTARSAACGGLAAGGPRRSTAGVAPRLVQAECDRLADLVAPYLDLDRIASLCGVRLASPC